MPDSADLTNSNLPPVGDPAKAEKYIDHLINLLKWDKATVTHTDSKKHNSSMQDHYRINLGHYDAEISHSVNPHTNQNLYVLLFTNVNHLKSGHADQAILSYLYLHEPTFRKFKTAVENHFERLRREAEERRFKTAMQPIDDYISKAITQAEIEQDKKLAEEQAAEIPFVPKPLVN